MHLFATNVLSAVPPKEQTLQIVMFTATYFLKNFKAMTMLANTHKGVGVLISMHHFSMQC